VASPLVRGTGCGLAGRCQAIGSPTEVHCVQIARVKAMARTPPKDKGLPLSRWSCPNLAEQAITDGIRGSISPATIRRWLTEDALKPWQYQSWIFITDPDFAVKAQRVLDLYDRTWDGTPLGAGDYVISADENLHPGPLPLPPHPACRQGPPDPGQP
jgi:hypothetical protein